MIRSIWSASLRESFERFPSGCERRSSSRRPFIFPFRGSAGRYSARPKLPERGVVLGDPRNWWLETLDQLAATPLPLRPNHITEICNLPPIHQDPFDRALIAQATVEDLTLVTTGGAIAEYAGERFRVLQ